MSAVLKFIIIIIIIIHASFLFNTTQYLYTNKRNEGDVKEITIGCLSCHTVKDVPLRSLRTTAHRRQLTGQHGATMEIKRYKISKSGSLLARSKLSAVGLSFHLISSCLIYPLSARVVGAPQMISQPVSSIFPSGNTALWDLPNSRPVHSLMLSSHLFLSASSSSPFHCALRDSFG